MALVDTDVIPNQTCSPPRRSRRAALPGPGGCAASTPAAPAPPASPPPPSARRWGYTHRVKLRHHSPAALLAPLAVFTGMTCRLKNAILMAWLRSGLCDPAAHKKDCRAEAIIDPLTSAARLWRRILDSSGARGTNCRPPSAASPRGRPLPACARLSRAASLFPAGSAVGCTGSCGGLRLRRRAHARPQQRSRLRRVLEWSPGVRAWACGGVLCRQTDMMRKSLNNRFRCWLKLAQPLVLLHNSAHAYASTNGASYCRTLPQIQQRCGLHRL